MSRMQFILLIPITSIAFSSLSCGEPKSKADSDKAQTMPLPAFAMKDGDGKEYSNKSFENCTGMMSFVASWCGPCKTELAEANALAQKYSQLLVLAITYESPEFYGDVMESLKASIPILQADSAFFAAMGVSQLPTRMLISKGNIVSKVTGAPVPPDTQFDRMLKKCLGIDKDTIAQSKWSRCP